MRHMIVGMVLGFAAAAAGFSVLYLEMDARGSRLEARLANMEAAAGSPADALPAEMDAEASATPFSPEELESMVRGEVDRRMAIDQPARSPESASPGGGISSADAERVDALDQRVAALEGSLGEVRGRLDKSEGDWRRRMGRRMSQHDSDENLSPEEREQRQEERRQRELEMIRRQARNIAEQAGLSELSEVEMEKFSLTIQEQFAEQRRLMEQARADGKEISWAEARDAARKTTDSKLTTFLSAEDLQRFQEWRAQQSRGR